MKSVLRTIAIIVFATIFCYCGYSLWQTYEGPKSNAELIPDIQSIQGTIIETTPNETFDSSQESVPETTVPKVITPEMQATTAWKTVNKHVIGVLSIQDLKNEPIVQTEVQNEYLRLDINGNKNNNGTLFAAQDSELGKSNTTCIFGHAMKSGAMFGRLNEYKTLSYLKENPTFTISSEDDTYTCKIVGVLLPSGNYALNNWYYADPYLTEEEFEVYKFEVRTRSMFVIEDKFDYESKYVMLSTCSYDATTERLVIVARIMQEGEKVDTSSWSTNPLVLRSVEYYNERGKTKPSITKLQENYDANYSN